MSSAANAAFNDTLVEFLDELTHVFPEERALGAFSNSLELMVSMNAGMPRALFRDALTPFADMLAARDAAVFSAIKFPGGVDLAALWARNLSDATRLAIWDYLELLTTLCEDSASTALVVSDAARKGADDSAGAGVFAAARASIEELRAQGVDPASMVDDVLRDVPADVVATIRSLADECAAKLADGDASLESVISDVVGRLEGLDLTGLEKADMSALARFVPVPGLLGVLADDPADGGDPDAPDPAAMLRMLDAMDDEAADKKKKKKKAKKPSGA